ncbi:MAG: methyltransferase domain-containing protein [Ignavibacteriaceae bacterium]
MNSEISVFLPAGMKQFRTLKNKYILNNKKILVIGAGSERICHKMIEYGAASVVTIVNEYESLISARLVLSKENNIIVKMMEYDNTDFNDDEFDLVYAQASVSTSNRNKIIKEIKRILTTDGVLCVGEITVLKEAYPAFVKDIFKSSDILPLQHNSCKEYYSDRKFEVLYEEDLSTSLRSFYETAAQTLREEINNLSENDKSYYKKLLNKISHESNAYLNLGADKYIGFKMLLLKI